MIWASSCTRSSNRFRADQTEGAPLIEFQSDSSVTGQWDPSRIDQVASNLIANAVSYGKGAPFHVSVHAVGDAARIIVRDEGIGIAADQRMRIFERFERAVSSSNYSGLGLGLWIAKQIVDAHGGQIEVDSELGHGATFTVTLPRSRAHRRVGMMDTRIVVIDDDADLRKALCWMLRLEGFEVSGFSDATEAISRIEGGLPADLILLDLMMPRMNGWEFCTYRAQSSVLTKVPVIVITARQSVVPPAGVSEILLKPFDPQLLQAAIARALARPSVSDQE